jgi:hypothetical protein
MDTALAGVKADAIAPTPRKARRQTIEPAPPRPLVLVCERCDKRIRGSGAGFACVDLREASAAARDHLRTADGTPVKAAWRVLHVKCAPEVVKPLNPYFRVWGERIATVDALLDAVAELSRLPWFGSTDWGGLVRRILADTDEYADWLDSPERAELLAAKKARRRQFALSPDDPRHGTLNGYANYGCRCDRCKAVNAQRGRRERANAPQSDQHDGSQAMSRARAVGSTAKRTETGTDT